MRAWQLTGVNQPLQLVEKDDPVPGPGQVVIDVHGAGLCHSDCGFCDGTLTYMLPGLPMTLGHEVAGSVSAIGEGVDGWQIGDRVVLNGPENFAAGWSCDGGYADKCLALAEGLRRIPEGVSYMQAAAATDAGATAYNAVMVSGELKPGMKFGIVGLGGLGMTGARLAIVNGAEVYGAEIREEAWETAKANGVKEMVRDVMDLAPFECDVIVDFAGFGETTAKAINAVKMGGMVVQVGLGKTEATISTTSLTGRAVTLRGSRGGLMPDAVVEVLKHMEKGELTIAASPITFDEIPEGLDRLAKGGAIGRLVAEL